MKFRTLAPSLGCLAVVALAEAGCTRMPRDGGAVRDQARVRADVARRIGHEVPAPSGTSEDRSLDPTARRLLEAPLTEESAVRIAVLNNRTVRGAYERLGIARADLIQAGLIANPVLSGNAKIFSGGTEIEVGLAQPFLDLFLRPLRRRVAAADLEAAQAGVAGYLVRLAYEVRRAVVTARAAERLLALRRHVLETAAASRDLMKSLHDAGNVVDARLTVEEVGLARARIDAAEAEAAAKEAREPLNVLLGLGDGSPAWTLADGLSDAVPENLPPEGAETRAVAASLDLAGLKARVASAEGVACLTRRRGGLGLVEAGPVGKRESGGEWGFGPEAAVTLPLFDQGQARNLGALASLRERQAEETAAEVEVRSAARTFRDRATSLRDRARALRETYLPLRARLVQEVLQNYNAMQIGAFPVLEARQHEIDAQREHLETLREAWTARLDLEEILAGSLDRARLTAPGLPKEAEPPSAVGGH